MCGDMSRIPPNPFTGTPTTRVLPPATVLHRVARYQFPVDSFNPTPAHRYFDGGRFDSTDDDPYTYFYAALTLEGAVAERLLRDRPRDATGRPVVLARKELENLHACSVVAGQALTLIDLTSLAGLAAVGTDPWLTTIEAPEYAQTRHWGHQIRTWAPDAQGFIWRSRRDPGTESLVLFGDRVPPGVLSTSGAPSPVKLDTRKGRKFLAGVLPQGYAIAK